jgi:Type ISP C-terminal specificity domain
MIVGARGASNRLNSILLGDDGQGHAEQSADGAYDQLTACLGGACYDVYLNDVAYWRGVPARVWEYTIGGYQVMKKWLSYRERPLLGRELTPDEARYVTEMTRRITAILLLEPALDANYERVKAETYPWPGGS